ncbi:hypothetical protein SETIT_9G466300v2 [Setaria italica]|uniref:Uncharacterized protein n=1 Tax=Setaria italica TaxID=4555 RepID=A0A368ST34_SETIT|nr:hypothetical protein SETIT_9G466300v2 [Setaria italica]
MAAMRSVLAVLGRRCGFSGSSAAVSTGGRGLEIHKAFRPAAPVLPLRPAASVTSSLDSTLPLHSYKPTLLLNLAAVLCHLVIPTPGDSRHRVSVPFTPSNRGRHRRNRQAAPIDSASISALLHGGQDPSRLHLHAAHVSINTAGNSRPGAPFSRCCHSFSIPRLIDCLL